LRPGRFDRIIVLDRPDIAGREEILKVHVRNVKTDKDVNLKSIARQTPGFSGADIANLVNEAALLAARNGKPSVSMREMKDAIERVIAGPEKKSRVISADEKKIVAYHESGHALLSLFIPEVDSPRKITIIPRGSALGYTFKPPREDRYLLTKKKLLGEITVALGGRASEELIFGELTTGAYNDLKEATEIARNMVTKYGMSEDLGTLIFGRRQEQVFLGRDIVEDRNYSEQTAQMIDKEVKTIVDKCYQRAKDELKKHEDKLRLLADTLLEKEVMEEDEVNKLLGMEKKKEEPKKQKPLEEKRPDEQKA
jgi:cell division protease FtsH